jgi:hypothetical protein
LTPEEALSAWSTLESDTGIDPELLEADLAAQRVPYRHYRPFADAADAFVAEAQTTKRFYTGIPQFDEQMRGFGPGHLAIVAGYSHSGKTLLVLHMLRNNKDAKIALFSPDEPATLILTKLTSVTHGIPAWELEARVASGDQDAIRLLRSTALEEFPNLVVFDKTLNRQVLVDGYKEACDVWGDEADVVVVDYVDLIQGVDMVPAKFDILKSFVHEVDSPLVAIHQSSRSSGAGGQEMTISSGNYGGEQHATFMLGVWRKKAAIMAEMAELRVKIQRTGSEAATARLAELEHDLSIHEYTLTANVVKNKRPGGQLVDAVDFELASSTGRLYQLGDDLPKQYLNKLRASGQRPPQPAAPSTPQWTEAEMF